MQITFKKISYYLSRIFKLVTYFQKKITSCWTEKYKLYKIPWHLRRSDARNKTLNKKDETQVNIKDLDAAIMFSTNVMNEQTENNKQTNCFLKIHKFTVKSNSRTHWLDRQDPFPQVKSAEHMAKINTKIICLRSGAFPNFSWKLYQKYIKRLWNIYKHINISFHHRTFLEHNV